MRITGSGGFYEKSTQEAGRARPAKPIELETPADILRELSRVEIVEKW